MCYSSKIKSAVFPYLMLEIQRSYEEQLFTEGEDRDEVAEQMLCYQQSGIFAEKTLIEMSFMESLNIEHQNSRHSHPVSSSKVDSCHPCATNRFSSLLKKIGRFLLDLV